MVNLPLNLILIMFDDLRPELSIYGRKHMITPNFERLAKRAVVFDKAFAQIAVCNPSRDSLLTGLRPDTTGTYSFQSSFRPHLSLPTQLVRADYSTAAYGKIFHWEYQDTSIWNEELYDNKWYEYQNQEWEFQNSSTFPDKSRKIDEFRDTDFTNKAIERLKLMTKQYNRNKKNFMLSIGYKLPHICVHIPYEYYALYKDKTSYFKMSPEELSYPPSSPDVSYRCCGDEAFKFINNEGTEKYNRTISLGSINTPFTQEMYNELMMGYSGAVSFVDSQLGRLLDEMDKEEIWENTVVVLTSDHGMHNGEKGIWEKWSLFDESTRVPLIIAHPNSPYKGQHYPYPVELVDVYPTIVDLIQVPFTNICKPEDDLICHELQGNSLAKVIVGEKYYNEHIGNTENHSKNFNRILDLDINKIKNINNKYHKWDMKATYVNTPPHLHHKYHHKISKYNTTVNYETLNYLPLIPLTETDTVDESYKTREESYNYKSYMVSSPDSHADKMPILTKQFAITQSWRCASLDSVLSAGHWHRKYLPMNHTSSSSSGSSSGSTQRLRHRPVVPTDGMDRPYSGWDACNKDKDHEKDRVNEISVLGYSLRTNHFRYTAWYYYNYNICMPILDLPPYEEELYDHRHEKPEDFTHLEIQNIVKRSDMKESLSALRMQLVQFIKQTIVFRGCFYD